MSKWTWTGVKRALSATHRKPRLSSCIVTTSSSVVWKHNLALPGGQERAGGSFTCMRPHLNIPVSSNTWQHGHNVALSVLRWFTASPTSCTVHSWGQLHRGIRTEMTPRDGQLCAELNLWLCLHGVVYTFQYSYALHVCHLADGHKWHQAERRWLDLTWFFYIRSLRESVLKEGKNGKEDLRGGRTEGPLFSLM